MEEDWDEFYRRTKELVDRIFNEFMKEFEKFLQGVEDFEEGREEVKVYGFRVEIGPDGVPKIYSFGDKDFEHVKPNIVVINESENVEEPFTDVYDEEDVIRVIVELPGAKEENIVVTPLDNKHLLVEALTLGKKYRKNVELPVEVDINSLKTSYRNGVLEISVKKIKKEASYRS